MNAILLLNAVLAGVALAQNNHTQTPAISLGAGMYAGYYDFLTVEGGTVDWEGGNGYGIGVVAEYRCNEVLSLQSGLWYGINYIDLTMEGSDTIEARTENWVVPFYFIASLPIDHFSMGLLAGMSFMHIRKSEFFGEMETSSSLEVTEYLNYDMYGFAAGFQMKIGVARFIDLFVQGLAEIYANKFIIFTDRTADYLYDFRVIAGVMLRTY